MKTDRTDEELLAELRELDELSPDEADALWRLLADLARTLDALEARWLGGDAP